MIKCYIALGSNLRSPKRQLRQAIIKLTKVPRFKILRQSQHYLSIPANVSFQPTYVNMVISAITNLSPIILLKYLQAIEHRQLRVRRRNCGPRTIDLDLLLYGQKSINTQHLIVPHPRMLRRDFVLIPLLEVAPNLQLPNNEFVKNHLKSAEKYLK